MWTDMLVTHVTATVKHSRIWFTVVSWGYIWITESQNHRITESQNHRTVGVGSVLWGSSSPIPLLKQVHPELIARDHIQAGSEYL